MKTISIILSSLAILNSASAAPQRNSMDLIVKDVECVYRAVKPSFDHICNDDHICTFGEDDLELGGSVKIRGLEYTMGHAVDKLYMDAKLNIPIGYGSSMDFSLLKDTPINFCDSLHDGSCADGEYNFNTTFNMPSLQSTFLSWAGSGWSGTVQMKLYGERDHFYLNRQLLGDCTLDVDLVDSGKSMEDSTGRFFMVTFMALVTIGLLLVVTPFASAQSHRKSCNQFLLPI